MRVVYCDDLGRLPSRIDVPRRGDLWRPGLYFIIMMIGCSNSGTLETVGTHVEYDACLPDLPNMPQRGTRF